MSQSIVIWDKSKARTEEYEEFSKIHSRLLCSEESLENAQW